MSKLFRVIVASIMAVVICAWGAPLRADIDEASEAISISVQIAGSTSLNVNYLITATGAPGAGTLGFDLSGLDLNDGASLWTVADECFRVDYSSNYSWGIRIITDNDDVVDAVVGADVPITDYVAGNDSGGGSLSYSGLLSVGDIQDVAAGTKTIDDLDPGNRAVIAWQAYDSYAAADLVNYSPVSSLTPQGTGSYIEDDNVGDCWVAFDDWHYIGDKSDDSFVDEIFNDADGDGEEDDMVYSIVAIGAPGSDGSLVPATGGNVDGSMVSLADGDMVIFMASRFASTNWGDPNNPQAYLLEPDTYTTSLYIELIHE